MLTLEHIKQARENIGGRAHVTPLFASNTFSTMFGASVFLKAENLQRTGSFKIRGASNKICCLTPEQKRHGVIAASAGNHAQGVALAARQMGIHATIVMPKTASLAKLAATRGYGATVLQHGQSYDEAFQHSREVAAERRLTFIHAYDDPAVIAGQGTIGLEILEQLPDVDTVIVPAGGGGLLGGIALAVKSSRPSVRIIGVQATAAPALVQSFRAGKRAVVKPSATVADGIAIGTPGTHALPLVRRFVDDMVTVDEEAITQSVVLLLERCKLVVEGAGAVPLAALLSGKIAVPGKRAVLVLSGGNIDINLVAQILEHGLVHAGRFLALRVTIPDRPGQLAALLSCIAQAGANVLEVTHHRQGIHLPLGQVEVEITVETQDPEHSARVVEALKQCGYAEEKRHLTLRRPWQVRQFTQVSPRQ